MPGAHYVGDDDGEPAGESPPPVYHTFEEFWEAVFGWITNLRNDPNSLLAARRAWEEGYRAGAASVPKAGAGHGAASVEQMCRDLLTAAAHIDRSVRRPARRPADETPPFDPDPQARSSGELVAMANLLAKLLDAARA
jgi:hypothetical protein